LGLDDLRSFLRRHRRIALDTSIFIYQLEGNPRYAPFTDVIFAWLDRTDSRGIVSTVTMTELLVRPYRDRDEHHVDLLYAQLSTYPHLEWIVPSLEIADLAARMRALHHMRTPDALHAATALHAGAGGLLTNDPVFERLEGLETLVLDNLL
jgi:predicted nucleic acid-binding protein